jgi:8-oxo-dGTP pyrophosphatase MutT (NUDIX family)
MQTEELTRRLMEGVRKNRAYGLHHAAASIPSAVLVILHYHHAGSDSRGPYMILTKRSPSVRTHKSEISFPGGRHAEGDRSLLHTALRETEEEIGIRFSEKDIAGNLMAVRTITSNHFVVPFITIQQELAERRIEPREVEAIIDVPLLEVLASMSKDIEHFKLAKDAVKFECEGGIIWGATARIMRQLHDILIRPS